MSIRTWVKCVLFGKPADGKAAQAAHTIKTADRAVHAAQSTAKAVNTSIDVNRQLKAAMEDVEAAKKMGLDEESVEQSQLYADLKQQMDQASQATQAEALKSVGLSEDDLKLPPEELAAKMQQYMENGGKIK